jgi:hypothetical protein
LRTLTTKTERRINLLYILEDGLWHYLEDLASSLRTNTDNLKEDLNDLVKINYLNSFKNLDEIKQKQEKETHLEIKRGINYYKITDEGKKKFKKIKEECLKQDLRNLMRINTNQSK